MIILGKQKRSARLTQQLEPDKQNPVNCSGAHLQQHVNILCRDPGLSVSLKWDAPPRLFWHSQQGLHSYGAVKTMVSPSQKESRCQEAKLYFYNANTIMGLCHNKVFSLEEADSYCYQEEICGKDEDGVQQCIIHLGF